MQQRQLTIETGDRRSAPAFTLVEILIVVVIIGILVTFVIPKFTSAVDETREKSTKMNLHRIRQQIEAHKQQHNGDWPTDAGFVTQMA